jgi:hypothetical protein
VGFQVDGRAGDGRWLVRLLAGRPAATAERAIGLLDPADATFQFLAGWSLRSLRSIAVEDDGAYVAIEDERRVVRFRDGGKVREVLFPRTGSR